MSRPVLIALLTLAVILIAQGLRNRRQRSGNVLVAAGIALLVLTGVLRFVLGA
jgi:uncharacterized membrane protein